MKFLVFVALFAVAFAATKDDLVKDADRLKGLAQTEITKLKSEGKTLLAHEVEILEKEIIKVEKQVEALHPNTEVGKIGVHALDTVLKGLEHKLEAELKKLSGSFYDNTKDTLIADASRLRSLAQTEITKLKSEGKHLLAAELQVLDNSLIAVEKQVESLHPTTEVGKTALQAAETVLKSLESKLQAELKKLSGSFYDNTKDTLIADASRLKGLAQTEITKLKSEGKHLLAAELQVLENSLITLEKQVEALHPSTEVGKVGLAALEHVLKGLETKLDAELKKLSGSFYDNTKDTLIADASRLKGLAQTEITKLKSEGKHLLAAELQVLENSLITLEKQVEALHPSTEVGKVGLAALEHVLKGLETKLDAELKKLSGSFYDNTKDTLIADASRLKGLAQTEITKLKSEGKHLLAAELQVLENSLITLEKQVEALHPSTEVGKVGLAALEHVLKGLETKLDAELKKLSGSFFESTKEQLTADATKLKKLANDEIKKLEAEGKNTLANGLKVLEKDIVTVEKHLESLHPTTEVGKVGLHAVETVLKGLESKLDAELKKLGGAFYDNTKDTLIADASRLKGLAQTEITKLKSEGKHLLAAELQVLENSLITLEKQVEALHPSTEVGKVGLAALEHVLKGLETKLDAELKKLSGSFYDNTKDTLIADASRLKGLAQTEITKLKSEGKTLLAHEVEILEKEIIKVEKQVEALHPNTEVGKIGVHALDTVLKGLEHKLEAELKKLSGAFYDNTKDTLIADASRLRSLAQTEITKLKSEGKHLLAAELQVLDNSLIAVEKQVESLHPTTEVGKTALQAAETVLKSLESKLQAELKKLSGN